MDSVVCLRFSFLDNQSYSGRCGTSLVDWLSYGHRRFFHLNVSLITASRQSIKESISSLLMIKGGTNRSTFS
jgi:hypothetical protein